MRTFGRVNGWRWWLALATTCGVLAGGVLSGCGGSPASLYYVVDAGGAVDVALGPITGGDADANADDTDANADDTDANADDANANADDADANADDANADDADAGNPAMGGDATATRDATTTDDGSSTTTGPSSDDGGTCGNDDTPCTAGGGPGLCKSGVCTQCTDITDDGNCTSAYGSVSNPFLCLSGVCSPGNCRVGADCATAAGGSLCGVGTPNLCGKCTSDSQCASLGSAAPVCNLATGQCVAGTCNAADANPPAACPVNASDICCAGACQPNPGPRACCASNPNAHGYCTSLLGPGATCQNGACSQCAPATTGAYFVDPVNGHDDTGTGNATAGCTLKTLTRALQIIGTGASAPTTVTVVGSTTTTTIVGPGETFPIVLPQNVTVTNVGGVTVNVPAGQEGFTLAGGGTSAGIGGASDASLKISGQGNTATYGIVATTGSAASTRISNLTVSGFSQDGILVENTGTLSIGPGVVSTANGTTQARREGLHVIGTGHAIVTVPAGQPPTHFDANTNHGIFVDGDGSISITGAVTSATSGTGTVTTNGNYAAGLWIQQAPGSPPQNVVTGLVSFGNTAGNGLRFVAGSNIKLRGSVSLANNGSGLVVSAASNGSSDISKIDLGSSNGSDYGNNTLQGPRGTANNMGAGLCLMVRAGSGSLLAAGNVFAGTNCATSKGTLSVNRSACGGAACPGGLCDLGIVGVGNDINVSMCSHQ